MFNRLTTWGAKKTSFPTSDSLIGCFKYVFFASFCGSCWSESYAKVCMVLKKTRNDEADIVPICMGKHLKNQQYANMCPSRSTWCFNMLYHDRWCAICCGIHLKQILAWICDAWWRPSLSLVWPVNFGGFIPSNSREFEKKQCPLGISQKWETTKARSNLGWKKLHISLPNSSRNKVVLGRVPLLKITQPLEATSYGVTIVQPGSCQTIEKKQLQPAGNITFQIRLPSQIMIPPKIVSGDLHSTGLSLSLSIYIYTYIMHS